MPWMLNPRRNTTHKPHRLCCMLHIHLYSCSSCFCQPLQKLQTPFPNVPATVQAHGLVALAKYLRQNGPLLFTQLLERATAVAKSRVALQNTELIGSKQYLAMVADIKPESPKVYKGIQVCQWQNWVNHRPVERESRLQRC